MEAHLDHAAGFVEVVEREALPALGCAVDLGSGGGLPGLPLATWFSACRWVLVESVGRRAAFLRSAVAILGLQNRVEVVEERAEVFGRARRARFALVVARSFGPPAVVAECAAPLLEVGGRAVVSEPPAAGETRWSVDGLGMLGMTLGAAVVASGSSYRVLVQAQPCPDRYPRRVGVPAKRPLF